MQQEESIQQVTTNCNGTSTTEGYQVNNTGSLRRELELERQQLLSIFDSIDEAIYVTDPNTHEILYANRALKEAFGEVEGLQCYTTFQGFESPCPFCTNDRIFGENEGRPYIWEFQNKTNMRWYRCIDRAIRWPDGRMVRYEMAVDMTDRKEMEDAVRQSSEEIKLFAYSVSHDLKNPALAIYGLSKLLKKNYGSFLDNRGKEYCLQILKASEQLALLVERISDYIVTKEVPLKIEPFDFREILQTVREEFSDPLNKRQIHWKQSDHFPTIKADKLSMLRVMRNLVDNALKYGGDALSKIEIGHKEAHECNIFSVADDGVGIEGEDFEEIFGMFRRRESSRGTVGTGLGLAIVKEIAEQHRGKVWVEPGAAKGIVFYVAISKDL
jgi:PAS domain S-box-containing protein